MSSPSPESLVNSIEKLNKYWPYKKGYFAALFILISVVATVLAVGNAGSIVVVISILLSAILLLLVWLISRAIPKTKKNKVGFVISISCDDELEAKKIRVDFIQTLQRLVKAGRTGSTFQVIEVPSYYSERIVDADDAQKLRIKTKAHFILYGRVRVRNIKKKEHHFIELDGLVTHKPISGASSKQLSTEFAELLPRKVAIATEDDLLAFEFASGWAEVVAKYIIGIAAALSGDLAYAEQLYSEVQEKVRINPNEFPIYEKLNKRIPIRIYELQEARALVSYERWAATHELREIDNLATLLSGIDDEQYKRTSILFLKSISLFLKDRNVSEALRYLNKCAKQHRAAAWHFNMAFLYAYQGDLKTAVRHYRIGNSLPITADLISKIEDFILHVVENEPDKYQLFFCLGFFNRHVKGDSHQAINDLEKFLRSGDTSKFAKERELASTWLVELKREVSSV